MKVIRRNHTEIGEFTLGRDLVIAIFYAVTLGSEYIVLLPILAFHERFRPFNDHL
jgi:hypothetical protein